MLYDDMLQSDAYCALPHFARSVLAAIAAQYRGTNNGDLDFPDRKAKRYGIDNKERSASRFLLEIVGLIEITRQGRRVGGKGVCSLYALTCWPIDPSNKYDVPTVLQRPAPNTWARWKRPMDWDEIVLRIRRRAQGRETIPFSARAERLGPHVGAENGHVQSAREEQKRSNFDPHDEDTFLDSGRGVQQVERMVITFPHMSDVDIAVAFKWKINQIQVARVRQRLADGRKEAKTSEIALDRLVGETG
jgi:hypothetical protein